MAERDVGIYLICKYCGDEVRRAAWLKERRLLLSLAFAVLQHRGQLPQVSAAPFPTFLVARNDEGAAVFFFCTM